MALAFPHKVKNQLSFNPANSLIFLIFNLIILATDAHVPDDINRVAIPNLGVSQSSISFRLVLVASVLSTPFSIQNLIAIYFLGCLTVRAM
ncbi:MAG: hypothetical protein RMX59_021270 [Nostoc sp. DedSLP05]